MNGPHDPDSFPEPNPEDLAQALQISVEEAIVLLTYSLALFTILSLVLKGKVTRCPQTGLLEIAPGIEGEDAVETLSLCRYINWLDPGMDRFLGVVEDLLQSDFHRSEELFVHPSVIDSINSLSEEK